MSTTTVPEIRPAADVCYVCEEKRPNQLEIFDGPSDEEFTSTQKRFAVCTACSDGLLCEDDVNAMIFATWKARNLTK